LTRSDSLLTCHNPLPPPPLLSEPFAHPPPALSHTFLSERNGVRSVDWPPTGSMLVQEGGNVGKYDGIGIQVSNVTPAYMWINCLLEKTKKHGVNCIVPSRKRFLSPVQESEEIVLGSFPILSAKMSMSSLSLGHSLAQVLDTRKLANNFPVSLSLTDLRPPAIKESFEPRTAPSVPRYDGDTLLSSVLLNSPYYSPPISVKDDDFLSTGNVIT
jgi:hypothetical protein